MQPLRFGPAWLVAGFALMGAALYFALTPDNRAVTAAFLTDKIAHAVTFFVLMVWFCGIFRLRLTPAIAILLLCYGLLIEYLQSLLPYRRAEFADVVYDMGGILAGWALAWAGLRHWARTVENWFGRDEDRA